MSKKLLEQKRFKLKKEIEVAKHNLFVNLEGLEPSSLLLNGEEMIPEVAQSVLSHPESTVSYANKITKTFFPENKTLLSIIKIIQFWFFFRKELSPSSEA